jgi:hypothetical protein
MIHRLYNQWQITNSGEKVIGLRRYSVVIGAAREIKWSFGVANGCYIIVEPGSRIIHLFN